MAHSNPGCCHETSQLLTIQCSVPSDEASIAAVPRRLRGLSWNKTHHLWRVRIYYAGKLRFVGRFKDAITAARAYDKAAVYLYGANAITNFGSEACLADVTTEVGPCIVRAKLEAEQAAASLQHLGSNSVTAATSFFCATAAGHNTRRILTSSSSLSSCSGSCITLQHANSPNFQGNTTPCAGVTAARVGDQQQQMMNMGDVACGGPLPAAACPAAAASYLQAPTTAAALFMTSEMPLPTVDSVFLSNYRHHHQQQHNHAAAVTESPSLPSDQFHQHAAAAIAAANMLPAATGNMAAAQSADQASLVQLLLQANKQQQFSDHVRGSTPCQQGHRDTRLLPADTAAAVNPLSSTHCRQLFSDQPLLFNPHTSSTSPAADVDASAAQTAGTAASTAAAGVIEQIQQQQQMTLMTPPGSQYSAAQSLALDQHLQALSLRPPTFTAATDTALMRIAAAAGCAGSGGYPAAIGSGQPPNSIGSSLLTASGSIAGLNPLWSAQIS